MRPPLGYVQVLKFNPHHDEAGRFAASSAPTDKGGGGGPSDEAYVRECLHGSCWTFATALQQERGGELVALEDPQPGEDNEPFHALVRFDKKHLMDAAGPVTLKDLKERYQLSPTAKIRPVTEQERRELATSMKPDEVETARQFIRRHGPAVQPIARKRDTPKKKKKRVQGLFQEVPMDIDAIQNSLNKANS